MKFVSCTKVMIAIMGLVGSAAGSAQAIQYSVDKLGADTWHYNYTLLNTDPTLSFDEITIYFDFASFSSLALSGSELGWSPIVIQPDKALSADGFFDIVNPAGLVANNIAIAGFAVDVTYFGIGLPASQRYEFYRSSDFSLVSSGNTLPLTAQPPPIPEPSTVFLLGTALAFTYFAKRNVLR